MSITDGINTGTFVYDEDGNRVMKTEGRKVKFFSKTAKIVLLIFGLLPVIYFSLFFTIVGSGERTTDLFFVIMFWLTAISIPGALIIYLVDVYSNKGIKKDQKHLWAALLFFGNVLVYPFYWYLHVWREPKTD